METNTFTPNQFLPGSYTPQTMPDPAQNVRLFCYDSSLQCWMQSDGVQWRQTKNKLIETFSLMSNATGDVSATYTNTYTQIPHVNLQLVNQANQNQGVRLVTSTLTGFTAKVEEQATASVLSVTVRVGTSTNLTNAIVTALIVER